MNLAALPHRAPTDRHLVAWTGAATSLCWCGKPSLRWHPHSTTKRWRTFRLARFVLASEKGPLMQATNHCVSPFPVAATTNSLRKDGTADTPMNTAARLNEGDEDEAALLDTTTTEKVEASNGACKNESEIHSEHSSTEESGRSEDDIVFLENVTKSYGDNLVLDNLSLGFRKGTAIIGSSGTGKSTVLRVIAGLEVPDRGSVWIRSWRRTKHISEQMTPHRVSMVFQHSALFDSMTVFENVGFELLNHSDLPHARIVSLVEEALARVGLGAILDMYPTELSGGTQRRVAFARAILYDTDDPHSAPEIILYDEPTTGLDPPSATRVENCIRALRTVCATYIVVTHSLTTMRTADRVVFLHNGRVVWDGPVEDVERTNNPYVRQFVSGDIEGPLNYD